MKSELWNPPADPRESTEQLPQKELHHSQTISHPASSVWAHTALCSQLGPIRLEILIKPSSVKKAPACSNTTIASLQDLHLNWEWFSVGKVCQHVDLLVISHNSAAAAIRGFLPGCDGHRGSDVCFPLWGDQSSGKLNDEMTQSSNNTDHFPRVCLRVLSHLSHQMQMSGCVSVPEGTPRSPPSVRRRRLGRTTATQTSPMERWSNGWTSCSSISTGGVWTLVTVGH